MAALTNDQSFSEFEQNDSKQEEFFTAIDDELVAWLKKLSPESEENDSKQEQLSKTHDEEIVALNKKGSGVLKLLQDHTAKYVVNKNGTVTFWPTPGCKPSTRRSNTKKFTMKHLLEEFEYGRLEASSDSGINVVDSDVGTSSFITASLDAWANHYPIRFKPEHIWLLILQAVAIHVEKNSQKLRKKYVNHKGKMQLTVRRDGFKLGSNQNDWEGVIEEFVQQIDANSVKDTVQLFDCDFSGSTMMEKICAKVTIMDICKAYYGYCCVTSCGFPEITLDGTKSDWIRLKQKATILLKHKVDEKFGAKWANALIPVLDRFIGAFDGEIDCLFWNSMIKRGAQTGSGGFDFFSGWFNVFYPFTSSKWENEYCVPYSMQKEYVQQGLVLNRQISHGSGEAGGKINAYPTGLAEAPVTWKYHGNELKLKFIAGFMGYTQNRKTLEICPNLGWCIAHEKSDKKSKGKSKLSFW